MKKLLIICALILSVIGLQAQNPETDITVFDRSKAPEPGPAPEVVVGSYESFTLDNGLEVFVVEDQESSSVSMQLAFLKNGPISEGEMAGIGQTTSELLVNGTKSRSANQIEDEIDFIAADLISYDGGIFASSLKKYQDKLLEVMSDVLLNPSFPDEKLTKIKKRTMSSLLANAQDPNVIAGKVVRNANYTPEHPYGEETTASTINNIDRDACIEYYRNYYKPNAAYLVMVGKINVEEAKEVANKYFNTWKKGDVDKVSSLPAGPEPTDTKVLLVDRANSEQSVINITYPINDLKPGTDEELTARVMNSILGGGTARLFNNLREDKGYTYGAYSNLSSDEFVGQFSATASVRNEVTSESLKEFFYELNRIVDEPVPEDELEFNLNKVAGGFARSLERPQTLASFAINTARYDLPEDYYQTYLQRLRSVSVADVQASARKYIKPENANVVIVGKAEEIRDGIADYGEIVEYRKDGTVIEKVNLEDLSIDDTSPEEIIANYIKAIGGADNVRKINTMVMTCSSQSGEFNMVRKGRTKALTSLINGDLRVFQVTLNGEEASWFTKDGKGELDIATISKLKYSSTLHEEVFYGDPNWKFKLKLKDVEEVDGKACYKVFASAPSGDRVTKYYDAASGLLIKEVSPFKGTVTYGDYKMVNGVMFPHTFSVSRSRMYGSFSAVVTKIEINNEVSDLFFRVF